MYLDISIVESNHAFDKQYYSVLESFPMAYITLCDVALEGAHHTGCGALTVSLD